MSIAIADKFEKDMEVVAKEAGLEFRRCSPYHFHVKGVFLLNVYPSKKSVYVQGTNHKTAYKSVWHLVKLANGDVDLTGVTKGKRVNKSKKGKRKHLWDLGHRNCFVCGKEFVSLEETTLEHKVPLALGGWNRNDNLALSHEECNHNRGCSLKVGDRE